MYEWQNTLSYFPKLSANEQVFINKNLKKDEEQTTDQSLLPLSSYNLWVSTKWKKVLSLRKA